MLQSCKLGVRALAFIWAIAIPTAVLANPAIAAAGCSFPSGVMVFYFPALFYNPAIGSTFTVQVWQPTMNVTCTGGSSLANTGAFTIKVSQVTTYNDIGGGHYVTVTGTPTGGPRANPGTSQSSRANDSPPATVPRPQPIYRGSTARSGGASVPSAPPVIPRTTYDPAQQRPVPREVAEKFSGLWSLCSGSYSLGETSDIVACADAKAPAVCRELISKGYFENYRDCRGELDRVPHRIGRSRG